MRFQATAVLAALSAYPAAAGGLAPAVMDAPVTIAEAPASSLVGWLVPLIILILIASMRPRPETCGHAAGIEANSCGSE